MIDKNDPRLTAYVLGELDEEAKKDLEKALEHSDELRHEVEQIRAMCHRLDTTFQLEQQNQDPSTQNRSMKLSDSQRADIDNALAEASHVSENKEITLKKSTPSGETQKTSNRLRFWVTAACVLLLAGVATILVKNWGNDVQLSKNSDMAKLKSEGFIRDDIALQGLRDESGDSESNGSVPRLAPRDSHNMPQSNVDSLEISGQDQQQGRDFSRFKSGEDGGGGIGGQSGSGGEGIIVDRESSRWYDEEKRFQPRLLEADRSQDKFYSNLNGKTGKPRTWKRVKATPNTSRLMVGDTDELPMTGMQIDVQVDGFRARVVIDYFFYNDRDNQLEGSFKMRLPNDASPYYFAFGESQFRYSPDDTNTTLERNFVPSDREQFVSLTPDVIRTSRKNAWSNVKEARMVPRAKAAFAYQQTTKRRFDTALVEWAGAGVFNAKVFPLTPKKLHRIVVGYDVNLVQTEGRLVYDLNLPEHTGDCQVDFRVTTSDRIAVSPEVDVDRFEGTANFRLESPSDKNFQVAIESPANQVLVSRSAESGQPRFFATQINIPLDQNADKTHSDGVFLVDTSLSSDPEKFNLWLKMLESILQENRDNMKRFSVLFFDVDAHWWQDGFVENNPANVKRLLKHCDTLALEGATDLYTAIRKIAKTEWIISNEGSAPDLFLLSDGAATWGETNLQLMAKLLQSDSLGSLYTYQGGMSGTSIRTLQYLANQTGGAVFSVANESEAVAASIAHRNKPWRLVSIEGRGTDDILTAGRIQWLYPNQWVTFVGRLKDKGKSKSTLDGEELVLTVEQNGKERTVRLPLGESFTSQMAVRTYGQVAVGQLENLGDPANEYSTAYARNFRVTGQTCSLLMLDSQADYDRFNIKPQDDRYVVASTSCQKIVTETMAEYSNDLADPNKTLMQWLKKLESAPNINFKMPTALKLVIEKVDIPESWSVLDCKTRTRSQLNSEFAKVLKGERLDYEKVVAEARRRRSAFGSDDALKAISSLIEKNPGETQLMRDVAFMAMDFGKPEHAYPLLKQVAMARPYDGSIYTAIASCLVEMQQVDLAMVFYEIAVGGTFNKADFRSIAATEYCALLSEVSRGEYQSELRTFAASRLETLKRDAKVAQADIVVTMMWNTDRSDVDLHVIDPNDEECYYEHRQTKMGGRLSTDITDGFGPEMFWLPNAEDGTYRVAVNYYNADNLRTGMRSKVYVTVYRNFGRKNQTISRKTVSLGRKADKQTVLQFRVK